MTGADSPEVATRTRQQPFVIEAASRVHDKLVHAPVGVETRESNRVVMAIHYFNELVYTASKCI